MFSFLSLVLIRAATVANSVIIVRRLGPADYGIYSVVLLTISIASIFAGFGVPPALIKFLSALSPDENGQASRLIGAGFALTLATTSLTVAAVVVLAPFLGSSLYQEPIVSELLLVASIGLVLNSVLSPVQSTFQGFERIREMSLRNVVTAVLSVPVTYALVASLGLPGAAWATAVNAGMAAFVNFSLLRRIWTAKRLTLTIPRVSATYRMILGYCLPALAGGLVVASTQWFGVTLLTTQGTFADAGRYFAALGLSNYLLFIPSAIGVPLVPILSRVSESKSDEFSPFLEKTFRVGIFLLLIPTLILIGFPEFFLQILYGGEFVQAAPLVSVLAPAAFLAGLCSLVGFGIAGSGRMWHGLGLNATWAAIFVVAAFEVVPSSLAIGLALCQLLAYSILAVELIEYARSVWSVHLRPLLLPLVLATTSQATMVAITSILTYPWRDGLGLGLIGAVLGLEWIGMSRREFQVLTEPLRKLGTWIHPPH